VADALRLYARYIALSLRAQLQYRLTFVTKLVGHFLVTAIEFFGIWALFSRFGTLGGWTLAEVGLLYGAIDIGFAIADATGRGFDLVANLLKAGDFDRLLLRPRSTVLQLLGHELQLMRIGRLSQGLAVLIWASQSIELHTASGGVARPASAGLALTWTAPKLALLVFSIAGTACLFLGLVVLQAASAFWTIESLEVWNALTYGGNYAGQYPMPIYKRWFQRFFTAIVPLACTAYLPALAILDRDDPAGLPEILQWIGPAAGMLFLAASFGAWKLGLRRHASTGT
jgi:ABC-2 type transport system permease protein